VPRPRVQSFGASIDGYGAGADQDLENPLGVRAPELMEWFFHTRVWHRMQGHSDGETGIDNGMAEQGFAGVGAWILGRNMPDPVRGPWPDESWRGRFSAGPSDELHLAVRPSLLGRGESLFAGLDLPALGDECARCVPGERATHVFLRKRV
jgi:dihydrofolate reductase